jgi:HK97 family phage portal protein
VSGYKLSAAAARAEGRHAVWTGPVEKREIIGTGALGTWASGGVSRQDGDNFRTNQVTLAQYSDYMASTSPVGLSATWACVNLIAGTGASLPCMVYRTVNGVREVARDHPLYYVLHDSPNFDQTSLDFWEFMFASVELQGNSYATIERRGDGSVYSLTPVRPDLVTVRRKANGMLEYEWTVDGRRQIRDVADVLHIRGPMGSALGGVSVLSASRAVFSSAMSAESAARNTFANGLHPTGVITTPDTMTLTKPQRDEFNDHLHEHHMGSANSGRPLLLDRGLKWQQLNITPEDAQMLESRKFSGEEICRLFGVPPPMVGYGDASSNWGTGKEVDVLGFQKFTLRRRLKRAEQAVQKQLLSPADRAAGVTVEFNIEGLLRGDSEARAKVHASSLMNGWRTINEVRAIENLPPIEGGDVARMQMQNVPITEAGNAPGGDE